MNFVGRLHLGRRLMCTLLRQNFSEDCERALNKQILMELTASYEYLAMAYHFDRCDVALPGVYNFFKHASDEERSHAETIMKYINKRGGQIVLEHIPVPSATQFGSIKEAMMRALELEKNVNQELLNMHCLASEQNDPSLCDFLETHFLQEQVDAQKQLADYIRQIQRCEKELGDYVFDIQLRDSKSDMHQK